MPWPDVFRCVWRSALKGFQWQGQIEDLAPFLFGLELNYKTQELELEWTELEFAWFTVREIQQVILFWACFINVLNIKNIYLIFIIILLK